MRFVDDETVTRVLQQVDDTHNSEIEFDEFLLLFGKYLPQHRSLGMSCPQP
jgi:hypothetical protein